MHEYAAQFTDRGYLTYFTDPWPRLWMPARDHNNILFTWRCMGGGAAFTDTWRMIGLPYTDGAAADLNARLFIILAFVRSLK